ncbi:MAG: terpene cyclase/mutase family protein [Planctomycetes bacterium]|nr:terpene cyclase/mutase family protein [Planctomycetota bacterium]
METPFRLGVLAAILVVASPVRLLADEPTTSKTFEAPAENKKDEPLAKQFSLDKATNFLDCASLEWLKKRQCFSCHTNYAYMYARPLVSAKDPAHQEVRAALEELVTKRWPDKGPRWDAEIVASAAALAFNDAHTTGKLHSVTRTALERMWTKQRPDGGWTWLKCNWPPMENDDHYGATLAALAVGVAPEGYAKTQPAQKGIDGIRGYLKKNPPQNTHHKAMILWVATYLDGFMTSEEKQAALKEILSLQRPDGGWSSASLGNWNRADKKEQDLVTSDGYGTGFSIYVLRRAGVAANNPDMEKGVAWLKANQRESGRWFTRSLNQDNKHFLTHAGSAFAVMALASCEKKE